MQREIEERKRNVIFSDGLNILGFAILTGLY